MSRTQDFKVIWGKNHPSFGRSHSMPNRMPQQVGMPCL